MGARPIANLNSIHFGSPDHPKTKHLLNGVVSGIGGYGNCIGIPTIGGETYFDEDKYLAVLLSMHNPSAIEAELLKARFTTRYYNEVKKIEKIKF